MTTRILIAEDDVLQGEIMQEVLVGLGYSVDLVGDGFEAVRQLRRFRYDLVLLDYQLPQVDGHVAALLLHDLLGEADRPGLIAITANADSLQNSVAAAGGTPFDAVVSKADGLDALVRAIEISHRKVIAAREAAAAMRSAFAAGDLCTTIEMIKAASSGSVAAVRNDCVARISLQAQSAKGASAIR